VDIAGHAAGPLGRRRRLAKIPPRLAALAGKMTLRLHGKKREYVSTGGDRIRLAHGSFDNDVEVVSELLRRISGAALLAKVENLAY